MNKKTFAFLIALLTFIVGVAVAKLASFDLRTTPAPRNYRLSGPYQHENLTIFLIHAPDHDSRIFTPLQNALERNIVVVHETNDVNELAIENVSTSEEVLVQAGDIVKGGQQDRVLAVDVILPAMSGKLPVAAFCVEQSRWFQRGAEHGDHFTLTEMSIPTKELRLATMVLAIQAEVWSYVAETQQKLSAGVAEDVRSAHSESSLQLALENDKIQSLAANYVDRLAPVVNDSRDVIGFAFAINNKLYGADIYPSNAMFVRFWPKLLKTAAVAAIAERTANESNHVVSIAAAGEFLAASEQGEELLREVTTRTHMLRRGAENTLFFETRDMAHRGAWVHRSYLPIDY